MAKRTKRAKRPGEKNSLSPESRPKSPKKPKPKNRTRVRTSPLAKKKRSPHAASQSSKKKRQQVSVAERFARFTPQRYAQAAQARYIADTLDAGLRGEQRGHVFTDAEIVARRAIAKDIYGRLQTEGRLRRLEYDWFQGYASPTGRVGHFFSRARWFDFENGGKLKKRLVDAYERDGDDGLADAAARVASELRLPLREIYTLFWSG